MKFKLGMIGLLAVITTSCGSSNSTTTPFSYSSTGTGVTSAYGGISTSFGSVTKTAVFPYGQTTLYNTKTFTETATVAAGDMVEVSAYGSYEYSLNSHLGGIVTTSSTHQLTGLSISLNGAVMGDPGVAMYGQYIASSAGTITMTAEWDGSPTTLATVYFPGSGVYVVHCLNTSGAAMTCPTGYSY